MLNLVPQTFLLDMDSIIDQQCKFIVEQMCGNENTVGSFVLLSGVSFDVVLHHIIMHNRD